MNTHVWVRMIKGKHHFWGYCASGKTPGWWNVHDIERFATTLPGGRAVLRLWPREDALAFIANARGGVGLAHGC